MDKTTLFITILIIKQTSVTSDCIYKIVDGSLNDNFEFNFTIFVKKFEGIILHCMDSNRNEFLLNVVEPNLIYSNNKPDMNFKTLCGCSDCTKIKLQFYVNVFSNKTIHLSCNNNNPLIANYFTPKKDNSTKFNKDKSFNLPNIFNESSEKLIFIIGNIYPFSNFKDKSSNKKAFEGCLDEFYYKNVKTAFIQNGTKFSNVCELPCKNNNCNGGTCVHTLFSSSSKCDCSITELNGEYCNRSLKTYEESNNYYFKKDGALNLSFKMSWRQHHPGVFCLIEMITTKGYISIWTNYSRLMVDTSNIEEYYFNSPKFIKINITSNNLIMKINKTEIKLNFTLNDLQKIKLGKSDKNNICKTFQGEYDFDYSNLELFELETTTSNTNVTKAQTKISIYIGVSVFCLLIVFIFVILLIRNRKIKFRAHMTNVEQSSELNNFTPKDCEYQIVNDRSIYDYIDETNIYGTVTA